MARGNQPPPLLLLLLLPLLPPRPPATRASAPRISLPLGECWGDPGEGPRAEGAVTKESGGPAGGAGFPGTPPPLREARGAAGAARALAFIPVVGREGGPRPLRRPCSPLGGRRVFGGRPARGLAARWSACPPLMLTRARRGAAPGLAGL